MGKAKVIENQTERLLSQPWGFRKVLGSGPDMFLFIPVPVRGMP